MARTLLGHMKSSNVMKAVWILDQLGLDYTREDKGNVFGGLDAEEYKGMNPTSLVPTLIDGAFRIWESNAILRYVCNAYAPSSTLYPADPQQRGFVDQWLDCQQTQLTRPQTVVFWQLIRTPEGKRDHAALNTAIGEAGRVWGWINDRVGKADYICGPNLTIADMAWGVHAHRWLNMDFDRPALANLRPWYDRLLQNDAYRLKWCGPVT